MRRCPRPVYKQAPSPSHAPDDLFGSRCLCSSRSSSLAISSRVSSLNHSRTRSSRTSTPSQPNHPSPCLPRSPKALLPPRPSLALPTPATRFVAPSAACRHVCGYFTTLSACVRLMRGLQDMITDAIANVRWRQPSD